MIQKVKNMKLKNEANIRLTPNKAVKKKKKSNLLIKEDVLNQFSVKLIRNKEWLQYWNGFSTLLKCFYWLRSLFISEVDIKMSFCAQVLDNSNLWRNKNSEIFLHMMPFLASFICTQQLHWPFIGSSWDFCSTSDGIKKPWRHSRSGWIWLWASWLSCRHLCSLQGSCMGWPLRVPSNSENSMILWFKPAWAAALFSQWSDK